MGTRGILRAVFVSAIALAVLFALAAAPALAAPPETPEIFVEGFSSQRAVVFGRLNPSHEGEEGVYEFVYKNLANGAGCEGEGHTPQGLSFGFEREGHEEAIEGLQSGTEYAVCVRVENKKHETKLSATATFTTTIFPEAPEGLTTEATATGVKLKGILNPKNIGSPATYEFLYNLSTTECTGTEGHATHGKSTGALHEQVEAEPTEPGLLPNTTYTFCLHVYNGTEANGVEAATSTPLTFTTPQVAPTVGGESFSNVGSSSAELHAQVDPGGALTEYFFEYGTTTAYGSATPVVNAGDGSIAGSVLAKLEGLQPNTPYYFRVVAINALSTRPSEGPPDKFSTFPTGVLGLPDDRGYELVSPLNNGSATVLPGTPAQTTTNGSAVTYLGTAPPNGGNGKQGGGGTIRPHGTTLYYAKRSATEGWTAASIQPNGIDTAEYVGFSSDLSVGILGSEQALTEGGPNGEGHEGLYTRDTGNGSYALLAENAGYSGSTPDGSHILYRSAEGLYDSAGGRLERVSVLPGGGASSGAVFGSPEGDLERVLSPDGSRIVWTAVTAGKAEALYVRENDTSPEPWTVQVDAAEPACLVESKCVSGGGVYRTASVDDSKVFFTDENRLTRNSTAALGKPDLYEYTLNPEPGQPGSLTDLTVNTHEPANVAGVLGASEDGSYIYFAAAGSLLNDGVTPHECRSTLDVTQEEVEEFTKSESECNVYVMHEGKVQFVAVVTDIDGEGNILDHVGGAVEVHGDWATSLGDRTAHVTPDGRHLVFWSTEVQTGFEGGGGPAIYMYDFGLPLTCVSCNPTGAPRGPRSFFVNTNLPESSNATYQLRDLSTDGDRVFFESSERLVSQFPNGEAGGPNYTGGFNTSGLSNVYEWERPQSPSDPVSDDSCTLSASSYSTTNGGCLYLLSGGSSPDASFFVDASESGGDVFFETRAQLVAQDRGGVYELYDARVGATVPPALPVCSGTGCQGVPGAPPIFATPPSVTFNGVGNFPPPSPSKVKPKTAAQLRAEKLAAALRACKKVRVKARRVGCVKRAHSRYKAGKASNDRRAK